jgi:hypothetical protein
MAESGRQVLTQEELDALLARRGGGRMVYSPAGGPTQVSNPDYHPVRDPRETVSATYAQWISPEGWVVQAVHRSDGKWELVTDEAPKPSTTPPKPPEKPDEKDEGGKRYVWNPKAGKDEQGNDQGRWVEVGPAPPNAAERAQQQQDYQHGREIAAIDYVGKGPDRKRITTYRNGDKETEAAPEPRVVTNVNFKPDGTKVTSYSDGTTATEAPDPDEVQRRNKPEFLSRADDANPNIAYYNPTTGRIETQGNPNYDDVKTQAERKRQEIMTQIAQRKMDLDEGTEAYREWFDQNVKLPFMQADEARARATEQRQALEAEERRKEFAATYGLQKQELGQKGSQMMIGAEESLLPYRAGPDEAADMSSAINGLAQGGSLDHNAAAGINFKASDFEFAAPDFKKIAAEGAKAALSHLTDYRPAEGSFATADYSGINTPTPGSLQPPSPISVGGKYQPAT